MATKIQVKTTFEPVKTIEPIYTGGGVSPDASGRWLATCVEDDVYIVDIETSQPVAKIEGDGEPITSLCLSPSASHLVVCSRSMSMRIYRVSFSEDLSSATALIQRTLKPHSTPVVSTCIDETDTLLATGGADSIVKVWDIRGGFATHTFHGHSGVVSALSFFHHEASQLKEKGKRKSAGAEETVIKEPNPNQAICLASGGEDGKVRVWDLNHRKPIAALESHHSVVRAIAYCPRQHSLLSASRDETLILWSTRNWEIQRVIPTSEVLESAGFALDGQYCYTGGENGSLRIWNSATGQEVTKKQKSAAESDAIVAAVAIASQNRLMSIHEDQTIRIYSLEKLKDLPPGGSIKSLPVLRRISGNHDEIIDVACVGPERSMLALATNTESIRLISTESNTGSKGKGIHTAEAVAGSFGADVALLEGHEDIIICLDVDWSGHWLATGAKDNKARLWRLDPSESSYACFAVLAGHAESLGAVALPRTPPQMDTAASKDPSNHTPPFLVTGSQDRTIKRWDTSRLLYSADAPVHTNVKALYTRVAHEKDINAIDVSPIAPFFASASQDRTIKIWSLEDGSITGILRGHKRGVWSIKFSPASATPLNLADGGTSSSRGLIVSGSGDRSVKVWSLSTYTCLLTFEGHSNSVLKVLWLSLLPASNEQDGESTRSKSPNQLIIASSSSDTLIKLWNPYAPPTSDHLLTTLDNHTDRVWALTTPPNSNNPQPSTISLISAGADARLTFWADTTTSTLNLARATASARIEQDQQLQNAIHSQNYREAIILALTLNHPGRLLNLFQSVPDSSRPAVDAVLANLSHSQLYLLLQRCRDWNTSARTAPVAQRILNVVLRAYSARTFEAMARDRKLGGSGQMVELLRALEVYTERHFRRMEELGDEGWILEYTLREMDEVAGTGAVNGGVNGNGVKGKEREVDGDVVMIEDGVIE